MSVLLKNKDAILYATAPFLETSLVLPPGCKYANVFIPDVESGHNNAGRNLVRGSLKTDVVGDPEVSEDGFITLIPQKSYINTRIPQSPDLSLYIVCRAPNSVGDTYLFSNQGSSGSDGASEGIGLRFTNDNSRISWRITTKAGNTWNNQAYLSCVPGEAYAIGARIGSTAGVWGDLFILNSGKIKNSQLPSLAGQSIRAAGEILLGSAYTNVTKKNPQDIYAACIFDNRLTSFGQVHAFFKDVLSGIVEI